VLLGDFGFWSDDERPGEAISDRREALSWFLDEELHREDW